VPLNESFGRRAAKPKVTKLSSVPSTEDLAYANTKARPGSPVVLSWQMGQQQRVLFVMPTAGSNQTSWVLRSGEEWDAPMIWRYATHDAEAIHTMLSSEDLTPAPAAVIPDELRPAGTRTGDQPVIETLAPPIEVPEDESLEIGSIFVDRYKIVGLVGVGGMGVVYKATQLSVERIVALKVLHPELVSDPLSKKRFEHEARAASTLLHPNLIVVHDFGFSKSGQPFMVMDYLDGPTLHDVIEDNGPLRVPRFLNIFIQCCNGLSHAHKKGVIHRDVKPCNIGMTSGDTNSEVVKLLDFGVAKVVDQTHVGHEKKPREPAQNLTNPGTIVGSPYFMSPEQCCGQEVDSRSDIYSLGCVMYASLTGALPFAGVDAVETMYKHIKEQPPPFALACPELELPKELERIVFKALEKDVDRRYQSALEMAADLERFKKSTAARMRLGERATTDGGVLQAHIHWSDILLHAGIITQHHLSNAASVQANFGGEIGTILMSQGLLAYNTLEASNRCTGWMGTGKLSFEHAVRLVRNCHLHNLDFDQSAAALGWNWLVPR
jgi:serine/threonine protein kinase